MFASSPFNIDHLTVVCSVAWPLNESDVGVDLVNVNDAVVMLISRNLHKKSSDVSIETRSNLQSRRISAHVDAILFSSSKIDEGDGDGKETTFFSFPCPPPHPFRLMKTTYHPKN